MRNLNRRVRQGDVCVRTLAARKRHPVARAMLVFLITVAMIWPVGIAYGVVITELPDSELLWGVSYPETDYPNLKFYTNYGESRYDALASMLSGPDGDSSWPVLTTEQRAYLSNPDTGGAFYVLAQDLVSFEDIHDVTDVLEVPTPIYWWVVNVGLYSVQTGQWQNPEWLRGLWYLNTTQQMIDNAITAVENVLSGNIPDSGGSGIVDDGENINASMYSCIFDGSGNDVYGYTFYTSVGTTGERHMFPNRWTLHVPKSLTGTLAGGYDYYLIVNSVSTSNRMNIIIVGLPEGQYTITKSDYEFVSTSTGTYNETIDTNRFSIMCDQSYYREQTTLNVTGFDGTNLYVTGTKNALKPTIWSASSISSLQNLYAYSFGSIEGDWPDPTPTPVPPTSPTVPVAPIVNNTNNYTQNTYNTTNVDTSGDVTALLQKILQALDTHCVHLQNTIADELEINAKWITDTLDNDFGLLLQYLEDLADWLKAHWDFDYNVAPYDDSSVLYWLRRIYNTLRTGGNTRPADPVIDPNGTGDWLQQLWQKFIDWMFGNAPLAVNELLSIFDVLRRKFPFSVPWDMAAILTALVHEPVVPIVQVPCYAYTIADGIQQVGTYTISLQAYDTAWGGVRAVLFVVFAFELMKRTRSMLDMLKIGGR